MLTLLCGKIFQTFLFVAQLNSSPDGQNKPRTLPKLQGRSNQNIITSLIETIFLQGVKYIIHFVTAFIRYHCSGPVPVLLITPVLRPEIGLQNNLQSVGTGLLQAPNGHFVQIRINFRRKFNNYLFNPSQQSAYVPQQSHINEIWFIHENPRCIIGRVLRSPSYVSNNYNSDVLLTH